MRTAEVVAALCLATDLAMGFPVEHGLHATRIAVRLGERLAIDPETASETYYACLLSYCGCTADAEITAETFGGDLMANFGPVVFLGAERDVFVRPKFEKALQAIADGNPNVRLLRIPHAGHLPWLDEPELVVAEIERFLATQPRSGVEAMA